ncbi:hypothetical protein O0L34_g17988 [Tuta absoluta]|nr:hypothetical protein O0L34_g17988 [Tuta absoluta]
MATGSIISIGVLVAALSLTAASEQVGRAEKCPPGNPLCHVWQPCDYQGEVEVSCRDCSTRVICTPQGGWVSPCWIPGLKNCVGGSCVRQPGPDCGAQPEETTPLELSTTAAEQPSQVPEFTTVS